jgi:hypothetical protein
VALRLLRTRSSIASCDGWESEAGRDREEEKADDGEGWRILEGEDQRGERE